MSMRAQTGKDHQKGLGKSCSSSSGASKLTLLLRPGHGGLGLFVGAVVHGDAEALVRHVQSQVLAGGEGWTMRGISVWDPGSIREESGRESGHSALPT